MIRIAICDDDDVIAKELRDILIKYLKDRNQIYDIKLFESEESLITELEEQGNYDILFMDIEVGELNGIEIVKEIRKGFPYINVIYITSHSRYVFDVFETGPIGFVRKPFDIEVIYKYLDIAIDKIDDSEFLVIKSEHGLIKLKIKDIMHIYSVARQVIFIDKNGNEYRTYGKLDSYEKDFSGCSQLMRIHKSHIVNFDYVRKYEKTKVTLYDGNECTISRERKEIVREYVMRLMK